jgi:hypothetical protein
MEFRRGDAIALVAIPLVVVAFKAEGAILPTICLCLAGAIVVYAIAGHEELSWQRRVAVCGLATVLDLVVVSYLYRVNLTRELKAQAAPLVAARRFHRRLVATAQSQGAPWRSILGTASL